MSLTHTPVLLQETINILQPESPKIIIDGTLGGGGHALEIVRRLLPKGLLVAVDQDKVAIEKGKETLHHYLGNVRIVEGNFSQIDQICGDIGVGLVDGILLDIGVSSFQLDDSQRGFSYQQNAPLDMRMDQSQKMTARDLVNSYSEEELSEIIYKYGEEKWAKRIAQFIVQERRKQPIETTGDLVRVIKGAIPKKAREKGPHPAKRSFQGIRIYLNQELRHLELALEKGFERLKPGGRFAVITFHSLEDRIVKQYFRGFSRACICPPELPICQCRGVAVAAQLTKKPIEPTEKEVAENPRARSAKLRAIERLSSNS